MSLLYAGLIVSELCDLLSEKLLNLGKPIYGDNFAIKKQYIYM